jgi:RHS repeat-associated protein
MRLISYIAISAVSLYLLAFCGAAECSPNNACDLPQDLQREIATKYPGSKLVTLRDLDEDDRGVFQKDHGDSCPGLVRVDFYGDGKPTLAFVLFTNRGANEHTDLMVAHWVGGSWSITQLGTGGSNAPVVWSLAPGEYQDVYGKKTIRAARPVIVFSKYESWTSIPNGSYTYDNNGNRKADPSGAQYSWDFENRLTQEILPGTGGTVNFKYDPFGRRVQKAFTQNGTTTTTDYLYDGANILETLNQSGSVLARYTGGPWIDETLSQLQSGTSSYYEQDGLGSVTSLSNSAGALANTYTYDTYGKLTASSGTITNPFQFTGREFEAETGLRFYRLRYFDSTVGRFVSEDPIGFDGGINFYRYVQNNPALLIDPFGLSSLTFNRANGSLTLYDKNGNAIAVCTAANNTTKSSNGLWPNGTYPFSSHNNHPPDPNGPYGSYGIDIFDVPGRTGMGVHSGRANSGGPSHPTLGCVRTTDDCMKKITDWQAHDPMTDVTIQ